MLDARVNNRDASIAVDAVGNPHITQDAEEPSEARLEGDCSAYDPDRPISASDRLLPW